MAVVLGCGSGVGGLDLDVRERELRNVLATDEHLSASGDDVQQLKFY